MHRSYWLLQVIMTSLGHQQYRGSYFEVLTMVELQPSLMFTKAMGRIQLHVTALPEFVGSLRPQEDENGSVAIHEGPGVAGRGSIGCVVMQLQAQQGWRSSPLHVLNQW